MKIFILAGEPSGDEYGAKLMQNIISKEPNVKFIGIGGALMQEQGLSSIVSLEKMSVMGFFEIIKTLPFFLKLEKNILKLIVTQKPDKIILIDYPGLNLRLAPKIKSLINTRIFYYISPQIWAWKEKRIEIIKKYIDKMIVIFEFEKSWYKKRNVDVEYVGHPFLDIWQKENTSKIIKKYNLDINKPILTLFPGSRQQELKKHLDLFTKTALKIKTNLPELQILLGVHPDIKLTQKIDDSIIIIQDEPLKALELAHSAIVASGTATLQSAIMNTPAIVVYKMNFISWFLAKKMVKTRYASMANIIADQKVFPEYLQSEANIKNLYYATYKMLNDNNYQNQLKKKIELINKKIGFMGASKKAAEYILNN
jgi:lipid-A-disaccharide synthase